MAEETSDNRQSLADLAALTGAPAPVVVEAVVHASEGLTTESMQSIASWMNLAETTFLLPVTTADADYRVRIFTTRQEIAFAGHPSIGSAHAALQGGLVKPPASGMLHQECQAGILPIRITDESGRQNLSVRVPRSRIVRYGGDEDGALWKSLRNGKLAHLPPASCHG